MFPEKLKYPKFLENVPCRIVIYENGLDEDTGNRDEAVVWNGKCIWRCICRQIVKADRSFVNIRGKAYVEGDIAEGFGVVSEGYAIVYPESKKACRMDIYQVERYFNPDGSVNHSCLLLM